MRIIKKILSNIHRYVLWALVSVFLWGWIFTLTSDTVRAKKVEVYSHTVSVDTAELSALLSEELPDGIRMVRAHNFDYTLFDNSILSAADILILSESEIADYTASLCPIPSGENGFDFTGAYEKDGSVYGLLIYDAAADRGAANACIDYVSPDSADKQDFYLCFMNSSVHIGTLNDSPDDAALTVAKKLLSMY
ncbi:MAG: hypothetical protein IK064_01235 [Clostridia bacterium]|nr:hypothetical protein [Clostridia bacterium]